MPCSARRSNRRPGRSIAAILPLTGRARGGGSRSAIAFDVAEHHRRRRVHAEFVRDVHRRQPRVRIALAEADLAAHGRSAKISPPPPGIESSPASLRRVHDPAQSWRRGRSPGRVEEVDELDELRRAERVHVHLRIPVLDRTAAAPRGTSRAAARGSFRPASGSGCRRSSTSSAILSRIASCSRV